MKTSKKSNEHFIVPFISDYGFKVTFARNSIFSRKAVQLLIDTNTIIKKLKMLRNEFEGMVEDARAGVYDVLCEDEIKRIFIIEMQRGNYDNLFERLQEDTIGKQTRTKSESKTPKKNRKSLMEKKNKQR